MSRSGAGAGDYADSFAATLARLGGDEFTILLDDMSSPRDAEQVAQRIQDALKRPFGLEGQEVYRATGQRLQLGLVAYPDLHIPDVRNRPQAVCVERTVTQGSRR